LNGLATNKFSFPVFYARRIKRIFPALILVLFSCLLIGWFMFWTDEYRRLGKDAAAGAGFISNLVLWGEANYFDVASDTKVLLHLWSLGIEEQYYLIWPALTWLAWRFRLNLFTLFSAVFLASIIYTIKTTPINATAAFYSPASRFWELATGSILAQLTISSPLAVVRIESGVAKIIRAVLFDRNKIDADDKVDTDKLYRGFISTIGLALIVAAVFAITRRHEFPGWWALMPVFGAYLIIAAGSQAWFNRLVLSNPLMVWTGLISYPLYLWHWPLLAFSREYYGHTAPAAVRAGIVIVAVALAWMTYRLVERPIRFGSRQAWITPALCALMAIVGFFGLFAYLNNGIPWRLSEEQRAYPAYFESYLYDASQHVWERNEIAQNQCNFYSFDSPWPTNGPRAAIDASCYTRHSDKSVLILGDSNAADLYYGLNKNLPKDVSVLLIFSSGCAVRPIREDMLKADHCETANFFAMNRIKADPPDVVMISSNSSYDIDYIRQFATRVKGYGVKHMLVLGQRPHWKPYLYKIVLKHYWRNTPHYLKGFQDDELLSRGDQFEAQLKADEPFEYVDEKKPFCNSEGCLTYLGDDHREGLITFDDAHLRPIASTYLAQQQLAPLILERLAK